MKHYAGQRFTLRPVPGRRPVMVGEHSPGRVYICITQIVRHMFGQAGMTNRCLPTVHNGRHIGGGHL
jgi:hypothetical protein